MKNPVRQILTILVLILLLTPALAGRSSTETLFYGFEMNDRLVGYMEMEIIRNDAGNSGGTVIKGRLFAKLTLLGQDFDLSLRQTSCTDPETGRVTSCDSETRMGSMKMTNALRVENGVAVCTSNMSDEPKTVKITPDLIMEDSLHKPYLVRDFPGGRKGGKSYKVLSVEDGEVHDTEYTCLGDEEVDLAGNRYESLVFDYIDRTNGARGRVWIDSKNARLLKAVLPTSAVIYLAEPAVAGKIMRAEIDDTLFAYVDTAIPDVKSITYLRVQADISTAGEWVTADSLNVPGQRFEGTVEDNRINGTFEIEHVRYNGDDAPPFPPDFARDESLAEFLEPEEMIESDDPVLTAHAKEITSGARDSWEAARRLSEWVAKEITYEIPGGTARKTFDSRKGECGSHSRLLTAFCRAVGIPARLATGCMYTPYNGGSFGQHAWNEVYMGDEAGWITIDTAAFETDFVDSGHIKLGTKAGFIPGEMEILDFRAGALDMKALKEAAGKAALRAVSWEKGMSQSFRYTFDGKFLGVETFTVEEIAHKGGKRIIHCRTDLNLKGRTTSGEWKVTDRGEPIMYRLDGKVGEVEYSIRCDFAGGKVKEKAVQEGKPFERTVDLPEGAILLDNNNFSLFALFIAGLALDEGEARVFKAFHPTSMQVLVVQAELKGRETVSLEGRDHQCRIVEILLAGTPLKMWIDENGRIIKESENSGRMNVTLEEL